MAVKQQAGNVETHPPSVHAAVAFCADWHLLYSMFPRACSALHPGLK